jgi:bacterial/archaeal transporter family-2 protein
MRLLSILVMVAAGFLISVQGPINSRLRLSVDSPVLSAAISFLSGGILLLCVLATGAFGGIGLGWSGMVSAPLWAYLGGALGTVFVLGAIVTIPQLGVVVVICSAILGQMIGSFLADSLGWFGLTRVPFQPSRLVGILLLIVAVYLVQRR